MHETVSNCALNALKTFCFYLNIQFTFELAQFEDEFVDRFTCLNLMRGVDLEAIELFDLKLLELESSGFPSKLIQFRHLFIQIGREASSPHLQYP